MKWGAGAVTAVLLASLSSFPESTQAFHHPSAARHGASSAFVPRRALVPKSNSNSSKNSSKNSMPTTRAPPLSLSMSYQVGIVGATGAVGVEIRQCLENRNFPVSALRIFGSSRSAGSQVDTKFGKVTVELFDVAAARECDVVFLAVSGDFSLEHARALTEGDNGCVCIDNSVSG